MQIIYRVESYEIMGACFEVYEEKGCGFLKPFTRSVWKLNPTIASRSEIHFV